MRVIISGINGAMGKVLYDILTKAEDVEVVCGVDMKKDSACPVECFPDWKSVNIPADMIIDFSNHVCTCDIAAYAVEKGLSVIFATTGQTEEEKAIIMCAAEKIPVFFAANMSIGIAVLVELAKITVKAFPGADIEIIEKHHNRKLDAPSGTALMIANAIKEVREKAFFVFGRSGLAKRTQDEIGIHSLRIGNIVGEHEVIISTGNETVSLKHEAHSRTLFADGALAAARYLIKQPKGHYNMQDILNLDEY